jgi:hypothetical protein
MEEYGCVLGASLNLSEFSQGKNNPTVRITTRIAESNMLGA